MVAVPEVAAGMALTSRESCARNKSLVVADATRVAITRDARESSSMFQENTIDWAGAGASAGVAGLPLLGVVGADEGGDDVGKSAGARAVRRNPVIAVSTLPNIGRTGAVGVSRTVPNSTVSRSLARLLSAAPASAPW